MTINEVLNWNKLKMRHYDRYNIILKSGETCFSLGEKFFHAWVEGELDLMTYTYTNMCMDAECMVVKIDKGNYKLFKLYIDNEDLQAEIYLMEDREYNRRVNNGKK